MEIHPKSHNGFSRQCYSFPSLSSQLCSTVFLECRHVLPRLKKKPNSQCFPRKIGKMLFCSSILSSLSCRTLSRAESYGQGLSKPAWKRITTRCSSTCQKISFFHDILLMRTQSVYHRNTWICFYSLPIDFHFVIMYFLVFCICHHWILTCWSRVTFSLLHQGHVIYCEYIFQN